MDILVEFGKILIPSSVVLYATYLLVRTFLAKELEIKKIEIKGKDSDTILHMRLAAYERMVLFLERIAPQNILVRLSNPTYKASDFHKILLDEIKNEYNHNIAQQIYISTHVWTLIQKSKDDLITQINEAAMNIPIEASGINLCEKIFQTLINQKINVTLHALSELKKEAQELFQK